MDKALPNRNSSVVWRHIDGLCLPGDLGKDKGLLSELDKEGIEDAGVGLVGL